MDYMITGELAREMSFLRYAFFNVDTQIPWARDQ